MKRHSMALIGVLLVFGLSRSSSAQDGQDKDAHVAQLEKQIKELESKVGELEEALLLVLTYLEPQMKSKMPELIEKVRQRKARAQTVSCANNLGQLWKVANIYMSVYGGRMKSMPKETGSDFWLKLTQTPKSLIASSNLDILVCPMSQEPPRPGFTTYRGPAASVNKLGPTAVVGCCEPGIHPDGSICVLKKTGEVVVVKPGDPVFEEATKYTVGSYTPKKK